MSSLRLLVCLVLPLATVHCGPASSTPVGVTPGRGGAAHPQAPGTAAITDEQGQTFQITQGVPGDPAVIGCADGQREAFVDAAAFPTIAGCIAEWTEKQSLRAKAAGRGCGDDLGPCAAPADACAPGWHMCGDSGKIADLLRVSPEQCEQAGGGRFVAAISHCKAQQDCQYDAPQTGTYACFESGWCSEPVCCGADCGEFGVCRDGVWAGKTHIPVGTDQGCGAIGSSRARGVMCCKG